MPRRYAATLKKQKESGNMKNADSLEKNKVIGGMLYIVATPIGNLADIGQRALKVLSEVDFVAAEDTRNSLRLLTHFGISKPLVSYHEHNKREKGEEIAERLIGGESCALVTDAGTPAISDPGEDLVRLCAQKGNTRYLYSRSLRAYNRAYAVGTSYRPIYLRGLFARNEKGKTGKA